MRRPLLPVAVATVLLALPYNTADAQFIGIKTIPIATGDQFLLQPSANLGMGGVSIAIDDPLLDPFVNPAKGARLRGSSVFGSPTFYGVSDNGGGASSLPLGATFGGERFFGSVSFALQQLNHPQQFWVSPLVDFRSQGLLSEGSATNRYLFGSLGSKLGNGLSVGGSVSWADLNAVEGVDMLYGLADEIDQFGSALDLRAGVLKEWEEGGSFEALALVNRMRMTHDVTYIEWLWDDVLLQGDLVTRSERNLDRTNTYGLHLGYRRALNERGWSIGGILTANYKSHPKIPNYEIMNIPRDPGKSWAYNLGVGISRAVGAARFGAEVIIEPIVSNTWAEADVPTVTASGRTLVVGARTIENDFTFSNALLRFGVARESGRVGFQAGLQIRSIDYDLDQVDNVAETFRHQNENWLEWTPSWGLSLQFPEFQIRYTGRATTGTGRPGVAWSPRATVAFDATDIVVAPGGPLTLQERTVITHQVTFVMPID